jgi:hypothetical protein
MLRRFVRTFIEMVKPGLEKESSSVGGVHGGKIEKAECTTSLNAAKVLDAVALDQIQLKTPRKRLTKYAILLGYQGKNYFGMQVRNFIIFFIFVIDTTKSEPAYNRVSPVKCYAQNGADYRRRTQGTIEDLFSTCSQN